MIDAVSVRTTRVPAVDAQGQPVILEWQTILQHRAGKDVEMGHQYHYDNSHVSEESDGILVVLATGEELRLCPEASDETRDGADLS